MESSLNISVPKTHAGTADEDSFPSPLTGAQAANDTDTLHSISVPASGEEEGGKGGDASPPAPSIPPSVLPADQDNSAASRGWDDVYQPAPATNPVIEALVRNGLYISEDAEEQHRIVCPWVSEHGETDPREAIYVAPTDSVPLGFFSCPCDRHNTRRIGALLDYLRVGRAQARFKPLIRVIQGEMHRVVPAAEKVLARRGGYYHSNGAIVTLKIDADSGDVTTEPVTEQALMLSLSASSDWEKFDGRSEEWRRTDVPTNVVSALFKCQTYGELPKLSGLARQPYLRRSDGKLVAQPGYDEESGVFGAFDPGKFRLPLLTRENASAALRRLKGLLGEFEFASDADRSAACSAMLTATIRDYLPVAPGFNITASSSGSGKSYLAEVIGGFSGPGQARNISYPMTGEEATKVVLSLAMEQPAAVCFDDMPTDWLPHGAMNRMFTSGSITERVLGSSKVVTARASSFVMGTGNNIRPLRDMARRIVSIYLLPQSETAATREYSGRPAEEVRRNRGQYVSDALTVIAAWRVAGAPKAEVPNIAGFEQWSDLCRHALIWLDEPDPAGSLIDQITHDPDREQLSDLMFAWREVFGEKPTLVGKCSNISTTTSTATFTTPSWSCHASNADTSTSRGSVVI